MRAVPPSICTDPTAVRFVPTGAPVVTASPSQGAGPSSSADTTSVAVGPMSSTSGTGNHRTSGTSQLSVASGKYSGSDR